MNTFANADPGDPSQQESIGIQAVCTAQFVLESSIIFRRQGSGEILRTGREVIAEDEAGLEGMPLDCPVFEQPAQTEQELLARMVSHGRTQRAKPAEPAQHMGIAAELCESADLGKGGVKIANEPPGNTSIFGHGERLQGQREGLDLRFENLFETLFGLTHGIRGEIKRARFATARAYSRQTSWGASWT